MQRIRIPGVVISVFCLVFGPSHSNRGKVTPVWWFWLAFPWWFVVLSIWRYILAGYLCVIVRKCQFSLTHFPIGLLVTIVVITVIYNPYIFWRSTPYQNLALQIFSPISLIEVFTLLTVSCCSDSFWSFAILIVCFYFYFVWYKSPISLFYYGYPLFSKPFIESPILSSLCFLDTIIKDQLTACMFISVLFTYVS